MSRSVAILTGEASGDLYGADLAESLRAHFPELTLYGVGGARMHAAGIQLIADSRAWGAIGIVQSVKVAPKVLLAFQRETVPTACAPRCGGSHRFRRV
jgi:lipid-A-disaccharide synthase